MAVKDLFKAKAGIGSRSQFLQTTGQFGSNLFVGSWIAFKAINEQLRQIRPLGGRQRKRFLSHDHIGD